ncbi:MAG: hypothetical protein KDA24_05870 [Deltaproteobacteria bacterium]|nr:hypothetical protein [Deltaproteobacteria bacterium]
MRASVILRTPDDSLHELGHGDILGRLWTAALHLDDARVSEAHAMISLRSGELRLLSLRAMFAVSGKPLRELTLAAGQRIEFARGLVLTVEEVHLPSSVLALSMPGLARQPLPGACWLITKPHPRLVSRHSAAAVAAFWFTGGDWRVELGDESPRALEPGWSAVIEGVEVTAVAHELSRAGEQATRLGGRVDAPLRIVCHYDTVVIERDGVTAATLAGQAARMISELAEVGAPLEWEALSRLLWPGEEDSMLLRRRFDTVLARLRRKLKGHRLRPDLVSSDGAGKVLLHLETADKVVLD